MPGVNTEHEGDCLKLKHAAPCKAGVLGLKSSKLLFKVGSGTF